MKTQIKRLFALLTTLIIGLGLGVLAASPAQAAGGYEVTGFKYAGRVHSTKGEHATALIELSDRNGVPVGMTYCIQMHVPVSRGTSGYSETDWAKSGIKNLGQVQWILNHSYPAISMKKLISDAKLPGLTEQDAVDATQAAIWHFTDSFEIADMRNNPKVVKLYKYLTEKHGGEAEPQVHRSISVPTGAGAAGEKVGPITIKSSDGKPIQLTVSDPSVKFVDAQGNPVDVTKPIPSGTEIFVDAPAGKTGSVTLSATAEVTMEAGRVFTHQGTQTLILAAPTKVVDHVEATVKWAPKATPITTVPKTTTPTTAAPTSTVTVTVTVTVKPTPATTAPTTVVPTTVAPTTTAPTTVAPTTTVPTTEPTTAAPTTATPVTSAPATTEPVTSAPVTKPTTASPITTEATKKPTGTKKPTVTVTQIVTQQPSASPAASKAATTVVVKPGDGGKGSLPNTGGEAFPIFGLLALAGGAGLLLIRKRH